MFQTKKKKENKSFREEVIEYVRFTIIVLLIIIPIRIFIAQPFVVSGQSMMPTFHDDDYIIVDELSFKLEKPKRGQVIIFRLPSEHSRFLIKRIIGLPGETVTINGPKVTITKKDGTVVQLNEDYIREKFSSYGTWKLQDEDYFVMGDNRNNSSDSRSWGILNKKLIIGKTLLRLFPFKDIALKPGEEKSAKIEVPLS